MAVTADLVATLNALARDFYREAYAAAPSVRAYVAGRGISERSASAWHFGYAPPGPRALVEHLTGRPHHYPEANLVEAGLATQTERGVIDFFRDRLMLPILDEDGERVLGFGSRRLRDDETAGPKYLNSRETATFRKRDTLYGLPNNEAVRLAGETYLVEGNLDMVALWQAGVENVMAACGTALTVEHLARLGQLAPRISLVLDADAAGQAATRKSLLLPGAAHYDLGVVVMAGGKDPAELLGSEGRSAWDELIATRISRWEYLWQTTLAPYQTRLDAAEVEARIAWKNAWCGLVAEQNPERTLAERLLARMEARLGLSRGSLADEYLGAPRSARDDLLLAALAAAWDERRALAEFLPLGREAAALRDAWLRAGAATLPPGLGSDPQQAETAWAQTYRGAVLPAIRARVKQLTGEALAQPARAAELRAEIGRLLRYR